MVNTCVSSNIQEGATLLIFKVAGTRRVPYLEHVHNVY